MRRGKHFPFLSLPTGFPSTSPHCPGHCWGLWEGGQSPGWKGHGQGARVTGEGLGVPLDHLLFFEQVPCQWDACVSCCKRGQSRELVREKTVSVFAVEQDKQYPEPCFFLPAAAPAHQATRCLPLCPGPPGRPPPPFLAEPLCSADVMRQRLLRSSLHPVLERGCPTGLGVRPVGARRDRSGGQRAQQGRCRPRAAPPPPPPRFPAAGPPFPAPDLFPLRDRTNTLFVP